MWTAACVVREAIGFDVLCTISIAIESVVQRLNPVNSAECDGDTEPAGCYHGVRGNIPDPEHSDAMNFPVGLLTQSIFLAGPTASGKSAVSLILAEHLNAEIVSLDSMTVYRGMDIGTAKPALEERERVPHHLIDIADPHVDFSVAEFLRMATRAVEDIVHRGRVPLFVGGTGLYLRSILRGMSEGPEANWEIRSQWERQARENGSGWLHGQLQKVDPVTAARLHQNDMRRIIRAIEVFELTGNPISSGHQHGQRSSEHAARLVVWLDPDREWLRKRIGDRVDEMMRQGWLEETRELLQRTPKPGRTAAQALGYRELSVYLDGETTLEVTVEQIRTATRQFAKRQYTWFRNLEECKAITVAGHETPEDLANRVLGLL
jgi:tRNA dimethylallyltransferase